MNGETFEMTCRPYTIRQMESCVDPGDHHARHRRFTGLAHYMCNCGYTSGWVPQETLPLPSDFIAAHMPTDPVMAQGGMT